MNKKIEFYNTLKHLIVENILSIPSSKVDQMYDSWIKTKDKLGVKTNFVYSDQLIHKNQKIPKDTRLKGIDLPSWFGDFNNRRIIILGIDPLRDAKDFKREGADVNNDVIIGTPYALHDKDTRESGCASYWTFINGLVENNNFVYCTDIYKTFYKTYYYDKLTNSSEDTDFIENSNHRNILINELELIKPDLIIAFGGIAHKKLLNKNCPTISQDILKTKSFIKLNDKEVDVYTVIHLSKRPRGANMQKFFDVNDIDTTSISMENRVECAEKYIELFKNKVL